MTTDALFESPVAAAIPAAAVVGDDTGRAPGGEGLGARPAIEIRVLGTPAPQGSKRGFVNPHTGRVAMVESSKKVKPWREAVKAAACDVVAERELRWDPFATLSGELYVETTFTLPRPKGHYRTGKNAHLLRDSAPRWPAGKPDIEKLVRSTRDALTDVGIWGDDAQVVAEVNVKTYPHGHRDALDVPGAVIRIYCMGAE